MKLRAACLNGPASSSSLLPSRRQGMSIITSLKAGFYRFCNFFRTQYAELHTTFKKIYEEVYGNVFRKNEVGLKKYVTPALFESIKSCRPDAPKILSPPDIKFIRIVNILPIHLQGSKSTFFQATIQFTINGATRYAVFELNASDSLPTWKLCGHGNGAI